MRMGGDWEVCVREGDADGGVPRDQDVQRAALRYSSGGGGECVRAPVDPGDYNRRLGYIPDQHETEAASMKFKIGMRSDSAKSTCSPGSK